MCIVYYIDKVIIYIIQFFCLLQEEDFYDEFYFVVFKGVFKRNKVMRIISEDICFFIKYFFVKSCG